MESENRYQKYKKMQTDLAGMMASSAGLLEKLSINQYAAGLVNLEKKITAETFKIMVLGQFKTGKSTFINSFLGEEVLPAYATPCTAVINEVKYKSSKQAILFFKNPLPNKLPSSISPQVRTHIQKYSKNVPPIEIPVDEIEDYVVIPMGKDQKEAVLESPYEKVELYWPLQLLENGVEIIDSPGLNEHETRTKVTMEYLSKADAVLFLLSSIAPCAKTEMDFIDINLHKTGFNDIYFLFNRFDQVPPREKERLKNFGIERLKNETSFGANGVFFISAYEALMGKINHNVEQFQNSSMDKFEGALSDFLINNRGKMKLSQPAKELKRIISEALFETIPQQKSMLGVSLTEIEKKYEKAKPHLDNLEVKKSQMADRMALAIARMLPHIRSTIQNNFRELIDKVPVWLDEITPDNEIQTLSPKDSSEKIIKELLEKVQARLECEQLEWQEQVLEPLISQEMEGLKFSIEANIENFYIEMDAIKVNIAGCQGQIEGAKEVSAFERVGAAALGFFAGDVGAAAIGGNFGFSKTFFIQLATQISAVLGMLLLGITNPLTMLPVVIGIAVFGFFRGKSGIVDKLKGQVAAGMIAELNKISGQATEEIVEGVEEQIKKVGAGIIDGLESEIQAVRTQVESIIKDIRAGEAQIAKKRQLIGQCETELVSLNQNLDNFVIGLLENK